MSNCNSENVYLNIVINHDDSQGDAFTPATFLGTKTVPFLYDPYDYYCSVIRFRIPLRTIPLWIPDIIPNQANPNLTQYIIGIKYGSNYYFQNLIYTPDSNLTSPQQNQPNMVVTPYYFVYSYRNFFDMLNLTLNAIYNLFKAANPASPQAIANDSPYFYYDPNTQLVSLIVHESWILTGAPVIFQNSEMPIDAFRFFINFDTTVNDTILTYILSNSIPYTGSRLPNFYPNQATYLYGDIITNTVAGNTTQSTPTHLIFTQEYISIQSTFNTIERISFISNTLPINPEVIPAINNGSPTITSNIITDYVLNFDIPGENRGIAIYNPTSQYRLIDMYGKGALSKIDVTVQWTDFRGNVFILQIPAGEQVSIKIAFIRKSLYSKSLLLK